MPAPVIVKPVPASMAVAPPSWLKMTSVEGAVSRVIAPSWRQRGGSDRVPHSGKDDQRTRLGRSSRAARPVRAGRIARLAAKAAARSCLLSQFKAAIRWPRMKAKEPGFELSVSSGPKSAGPPGQPRIQMSQRGARGDEIFVQSRQSFEPKSKAPHVRHSALPGSGS